MDTQRTPWDDTDFARQWNETYGMDMRNAPIRSQLVFPLIAQRAGKPDGLSLTDFGCGNGNLIGHFMHQPYKALNGYDGGAAILESARNHIKDARVRFANIDLTQPDLVMTKADVLTSVFVIEEIPVARLVDFFRNAARALKSGGKAFFFTQHPVYALTEDHAAKRGDGVNAKFAGHKGYFDTAPSTYALKIMNQDGGHPVKVDYHHKPIGKIFNAAIIGGLTLTETLEIPAGVETLANLRAHEPKQGDTPRFLFMAFTVR